MWNTSSHLDEWTSSYWSVIRIVPKRMHERIICLQCIDTLKKSCTGSLHQLGVRPTDSHQTAPVRDTHELCLVTFNLEIYADPRSPTALLQCKICQTYFFDSLNILYLRTADARQNITKHEPASPFYQTIMTGACRALAALVLKRLVRMLA